MVSIQDAKYEKLEEGADDLENVPLNEQQGDATSSRPLWQRRTSLTNLDLAVRFVLGFILVLTLLNIGFLLGDRLIGTTYDARISAAASSEGTIWSKLDTIPTAK